MTNMTVHGGIETTARSELVGAWVANTQNIRVEFLKLGPQATVRWRVGAHQAFLIWLRGGSWSGSIRIAGRRADMIRTGDMNFCFIPEGIGAEGELTGEAAYECAAIFIGPAFLPSAIKPTLTQPIIGLANNTLRRAATELVRELTDPDEVLPLFTEGWVMQALAYVTRAGRTPQPATLACNGLAPWQLRRAKEMLRSNLAQTPTLRAVALACKLSVSHFARAFKASTGLSPHQWLTAARIETAQGLLANSPMPLVEVADTCGFADQSHFSRIFGRAIGISPGAWRREHRV